MDADTDDLRRQILEAALHDPQGLERALELAERAYGWLAPAQVPRALPAPEALPAPRTHTFTGRARCTLCSVASATACFAFKTILLSNN